MNYTNNNERKAHEILSAISRGETIYGDRTENSKTIALLSEENVTAKQNINLEHIVNNVHVQISSFEFCNSFADYPTPDNIAPFIFLEQLCTKGLKQLLNEDTLPPSYSDRLQHELQVIKKMNFVNYFLVVQDYVAEARKRDIYIGPGRGSAAGSLVSFALGITTINPLKYNLLFERFLNVERAGLPDIDIDVEDCLREELVGYLVDKYGPNHVAYINTFQTIGVKMALRDVGRALDLPLPDINNICKLVDNRTIGQISQLITNNKYLKYYADKYPQLFLLIKPLIGLPRQTGTHAAGIIITRDKLTNYTPVMEGIGGVLKTQ